MINKKIKIIVIIILSMVAIYLLLAGIASYISGEISKRSLSGYNELYYVSCDLSEVYSCSEKISCPNDVVRLVISLVLSKKEENERVDIDKQSLLNETNEVYSSLDEFFNSLEISISSNTQTIRVNKESMGNSNFSITDDFHDLNSMKEFRFADIRLDEMDNQIQIDSAILNLDGWSAHIIIGYPASGSGLASKVYYPNEIRQFLGYRDN